MTKYRHVEDLPRNDADAALELYERLRSRGELTPERAQAILMLQDDPSELMRRIAERRAR